MWNMLVNVLWLYHYTVLRHQSGKEGEIKQLCRQCDNWSWHSQWCQWSAHWSQEFICSSLYMKEWASNSKEFVDFVPHEDQASIRFLASTGTWLMIPSQCLTLLFAMMAVFGPRGKCSKWFLLFLIHLTISFQLFWKLSYFWKHFGWKSVNGMQTSAQNSPELSLLNELSLLRFCHWTTITAISWPPPYIS